MGALNIALIGKYGFKVQNREDGDIWAELLDAKYFNKKDINICHVPKRRGDSEFWSGVIEAIKEMHGFTWFLLKKIGRV